MGLIKLTELLKIGAGGSHMGKHKAVENYPYHKFTKLNIAVDLSMLVYETVVAIRSGGHDLTNKSGQLTSHLIGIFNKTLNFLQNGNVPIYVFDGKAPDIKTATVQKRQEEKKKAAEKLTELSDSEDNDYIKHYKKSFKPSKQDFEELKIMFNLMGIPYIEAPGEADIVCAWLASRSDETGRRYAKGVCSDDGDILIHGARYLFRFMSKALNKPNKDVTVISQEKLLANLNLTIEQMYVVAALLGGDYNESIHGVGPKKAYSFVLKYKTLDGVFNFLQKDKKFKEHATDELREKMRETIKYYASAVSSLDTDNNFVITDDNYKMRQYQYDELVDFFCVKHNFDIQRVKKSLTRMKEYYKVMNITRPNTGNYHTISDPAAIKLIDVDIDKTDNIVFLSDDDSADTEIDDVELLGDDPTNSGNTSNISNLGNQTNPVKKKITLVKKQPQTLKDLVKQSRIHKNK